MLFLPTVGRVRALDEKSMEQIRIETWELRWEEARKRWAGPASLGCSWYVGVMQYGYWELT